MKRTIILRDNTLFFKGVTAELKSPTRGDLTYTPGTTVHADALDADPTAECAPGIFFCRSLPEALKWAEHGTVVTVRPVGQIVDTGTKLRARAVEVIGIADLIGANLTRANLAGANLWGADLTDANLWGADLTGADLTGANLIRANPVRADLTEANLTRANLIGANLARATLTGAKLSGANLARANLAGANLAGANLTGANLAGANLARALTGACNIDKALNVPKGA